MTNEERKVIELALEALEYIRNFETDVASQIKYGQAAKALKEALAQPDQDQDEVDIRSRLYQRIHELETQLAQPEQEPVAWMLEGLGPDCGPYFEIYRDDEMGWRNKKEWTPLYTTPPQRKPLTDEQIKHLAIDVYSPHQEPLIVFARAIEAAHGIKE